MASLGKLWKRGRAIPWALVWEVGRSLWFNSRDRVNENLTPRERQDFAAIVRQGRGRPWSLDERDRHRLVELVKKAATGRRHSSWNAMATSLTTLLPPRILGQLWSRGRRLSE